MDEVGFETIDLTRHAAEEHRDEVLAPTKREIPHRDGLGDRQIDRGVAHVGDHREQVEVERITQTQRMTHREVVGVCEACSS